MLGSFEKRLELLEILFRDPSFLRLRVRDRRDRTELSAELVSAPGLSKDNLLSYQWEALRSLPQKMWFRPQEWLEEKDEGLLLCWTPPGRHLNETTDTFREETYMKWLGEGLQDLSRLHRRGLLHLAQNERTWVLFQPEDEGGEETLGLTDVGLFADQALGFRVTAPALVAVAPELLEGYPGDARSDLYSFACLLLRQRLPQLRERIPAMTQLIDAHRAGRMAEFVPKTPTPLNEILRQLLQPNPKDRPGSAQVILEEMFPEKRPGGMPTELPSWSIERMERRQKTLLLSTLYSLIREGQIPFAMGWMDALGSTLPDSYQPYLYYLRALAHRRSGSPDLAKEFREKVISHLPQKQDKKLQVLLLLEEARTLDPRENDASIRQLLNHAWDLARHYPEADLQAKVLVERARHFKNRREDPLAVAELKEAIDHLYGLEECLVKGKVLRDLADLFSQYGLAPSALGLAEEALRDVEDEPGEKARRWVEVGLIQMKLKNFEEARLSIHEAKHLFSSLKALEELVWASAHEVRVLLAAEEVDAARKELKALRSRARHLSGVQEILDMVELQYWLQESKGVEYNVQAMLQRIEERAEKSEIPVFRDLAWSPADSYLLLEKFFRKLRKEEIATEFSRRGGEMREQMHSTLKSLGLWKKYYQEMPVELPVAETTSEASPEVPGAAEKLQEENRRLREELRSLREVLEKESAIRRLGVSAKSTAEKEERKRGSEQEGKRGRGEEGKRGRGEEKKLEEAPPEENAGEKEAIEAMLRKHRGNRNETAKELGIHRRTLFEKLHKYGLENLSFDPSKEEMQKALAEVQGKKNLAAEKLGMSRSSFYRRLKELGLD